MSFAASLIQSLALLLLVAALISALAALRALSLMAMLLQLAGAGALGAALIAISAAPDAGLVTALVFAVLGPVLLMASMVLTAPTASKARTPWLTLAAASVLGVTLIASTLDFGPRSAAAAFVTNFDAASFWAAPVIAAAALSSLALLGFGERGALRGRGSVGGR